MVCYPRFGVGSVIPSRITGVNGGLEGLCREEGVMVVDVWYSFSHNRNLNGRGDLHLNSAGEAGLGGVLDDSVRDALSSDREVGRGTVIVQL